MTEPCRTPRGPSVHKTEQHVHERHFVEEVGLVFDELGSQRMMGRIVGYLLLCEPPHQSSQSIAEYLEASRGAVSTTTRQLLSMDMIERVPIQNSRSTYFRIKDQAWSSMMRQRMARLTIVREVAASGLALLKDATPERRVRLQRFHDFYSYMEQEFQPIIDRWDAVHPEEDK